MKKTLSRKMLEKMPDSRSLQQQWRREGQMMFGQPDWFREKERSWGLTPITWQGWAYTGVWTSVSLLPFLALLSLLLIPEAITWLLASCGMLVWDVSKILRAKRSQAPAPFAETIYAGEKQQSPKSDSTRFDLHVRY